MYYTVHGYNKLLMCTWYKIYSENKFFIDFNWAAAIHKLQTNDQIFIIEIIKFKKSMIKYNAQSVVIRH